MKATTIHDRMTCEEILARLHEDDLKDLEAWRRFENVDSVYLGGNGRTAWQIEQADRAWALLSIDAQRAFLDMRHAVVNDLIDAIRHVGIPEATKDIDAIEALLGHDHPALRILPAYSLVDAYKEARSQVKD